jgi:hypothetical protein
MSANVSVEVGDKVIFVAEDLSEHRGVVARVRNAEHGVVDLDVAGAGPYANDLFAKGVHPAVEGGVVFRWKPTPAQEASADPGQEEEGSEPAEGEQEPGTDEAPVEGGERPDLGNTIIKETLEWVGDDPTRAQEALNAERTSDQPRATLIEALERVITGHQAEPTA